MKKNFLLAMVVMLMTAVSSFAQKEYNMVITLSNGTTVTLGHNDIKEITFNDGEVAISGNMVNTIDSLAQVSQYLEQRTKEVEARSMEMSHMLLNRTEELNQQVEVKMDVTNTRIDELKSALKNNIAAAETEIAETNDRVANTEAALQNANELIKQQSDEINALNAKIAILETLIEKYHPEE
jgi:chromosome segregation ATPase